MTEHRIYVDVARIIDGNGGAGSLIGSTPREFSLLGPSYGGFCWFLYITSLNRFYFAGLTRNREVASMAEFLQIFPRQPVLV